MNKFNYKARDVAGKLVQGTQEAGSIHVLYEELAHKGYTPVEIKESASFLSLDYDFATIWLEFNRVKPRDLSVMFRQLATIFSAGVPLFEALVAVEEQISSGGLKRVVGALRKDVEAGLTFSQALAKHPTVFSKLIITMVGAGEQGGVLDDVLAKISIYLENENKLQQKIHGALRYPLMVLVVLLAAFLMAVTFIIPKFSSIFGSFKTTLPLPTRILLGINYIMIHYWWLIIILDLAAYFALRFYLNSISGRKQWDQLSLKLPVFGLLNSKLSLSRFFRMLSAMISSGIPLVSALEVTANTAGNVVVAEAIGEIRDKIVGGASLSGTMSNYKLFPGTAVHMIAIGEQSGNLETMLVKSADYFDEETDYTVSNLMTMLEPFLILFLALLVLLLAMGIFLPMWSMMQLYTGLAQIC